MKTLSIFSFSLTLLVFLIGCSPKTAPVSNIPEAQPEPEEMIAGNDRDDHGCITTAGYSWSQVRQACIRIWEEGTELVNVKDQNTSLVCYLVSSKDNSQMEVFIPYHSEGIVFNQVNGVWTAKDGYTLQFVGQGSISLLQQNELIYKSKTP